MITFTLIFIILNYARTENVNYISGQEYHPSCTEEHLAAVPLCNEEQSIGSECSINCFSGNDCVVPWELELLSHRNGNCRKLGVWAKLDQNIEFSNKTMKAHWFNGKLQIKNLEIDLTNVDFIEDFSFEAAAFESIETLTLTHFKSVSISTNTFYGLYSLRILNLYAITTTYFSPAYLSGVSLTLDTLVVFGKTRGPEVYDLNGLTSGTKMASLKWIKYALLLQDTITVNTFEGLSDIRTIEISNCGIEVIGPGAFDSVYRTLELLKLNGNKLTTLPPNIFTHLLPRLAMTIYLSDNPWKCDCDLVQLHTYLNKYKQNFIGDPICESPSELNMNAIVDVQFCEDGYSTGTTESIDTNTRIIVCIDILTNGTQKFQAKNPIVKFTIHRIEHGFVKIAIPNMENDLYLMWFNLNLTSKQLSGIYKQISSSKEIVLKHLPFNSTYLFCLVNGTSSITVSLYDCSSYFHKEIKPVWIEWNKKNVLTFISIIIVSIFLCFILGIVFVIFYLKLNNFKKNELDTDASAIENESTMERKYSDMSTEIEQVYEQAIAPSRFEIVQQQLERDKYLNVRCLVDYAERTPKLEAPPVPDEIQYITKLEENPNGSNYI